VDVVLAIAALAREPARIDARAAWFAFLVPLGIP
jgi:hypothetical protein